MIAQSLPSLFHKTYNIMQRAKKTNEKVIVKGLSCYVNLECWKMTQNKLYVFSHRDEILTNLLKKIQWQIESSDYLSLSSSSSVSISSIISNFWLLKISWLWLWFLTIVLMLNSFLKRNFNAWLSSFVFSKSLLDCKGESLIKRTKFSSEIWEDGFVFNSCHFQNEIWWSQVKICSSHCKDVNVFEIP